MAYEQTLAVVIHERTSVRQHRLLAFAYAWHRIQLQLGNTGGKPKVCKEQMTIHTPPSPGCQEHEQR